MKKINFYEEALKCSTPDDIFNYFIKTLKPSDTLWSFFVNWEKVFENTKKLELHLNIFNYLVGKSDFDNEFRYLIKKNPEIASSIPALLVRNGDNRTKFYILVDFSSKKLIYEDYDFSKKSLTDYDIEKYLIFIKKTGLIDLFLEKKVKNLVDYMIGVEAGLDSNGRKNRGGHSMENIVEAFINDVCKKMGYRYLKEANAKKIKQDWGYDVPVDKSSRRYDFVINNGKELSIIETNFYGAGGSKLKSTAGEYRNLYDVLGNKYKFIWITDGPGWIKTSNALRETFDHNDYVFNLNMLENGILETILK